MFELTPTEERILGCLLEKERTTPDAYPLSLNSLRLACNQTTNRTPVVSLSDDDVSAALQELAARNLTRVTGGYSARSSKYRHLLDDELGMQSDESALICVLLLRGAQTPGELKQRTERMHHFDDLESLVESLDHLAVRGIARQLERRPGEKQVRYMQLLGVSAIDGQAPEHDAIAVVAPAVLAPVPVQAIADDHAAKHEDLTKTINELRADVDDLRRRLDQIAPE